MVFRYGIGMNDDVTAEFRHLVASLNTAQVFWNVPTLLAQQQYMLELGHGNSQAGPQFHNSRERFRDQHNNNNAY
jgi:hypothetical protein